VTGELNALLRRQDGVISVPQAQRYLSRSAIRHRLHSGEWRLKHRAVIIAHSGRITERQRLWVASLAAGAGEPALLGGRTALTLVGLQGFPSRLIHVLLPADRRENDPPSHVVIHRSSRLDPEDIDADGLPPRTTTARSLVDAASWARSDAEALTVVTLAFRQQAVTLDGVRAVLRRLPRAKRRRLTWTAAVAASASPATMD
jgi:hypothetical protein